MGRAADLFGNPNFVLNCLELILGAVSVGVFASEFLNFKLDSDFGKAFFAVYGVQIAFLIVTFLIVIGHILDVSLHMGLLLTVSILGCIVWLVTSALIGFVYIFTLLFSPHYPFLISAIASVNNSVIYLIDAVHLCKRNCGVRSDVVGTDIVEKVVVKDGKLNYFQFTVIHKMR